VSDGRPLPLRALAPAKLNLCLYVGPKRPDGLHEICSLFQPVTLADELVMEPSEGDGDEVVCPGVEEPNLAAEALALFRERFGWKGAPLRITIEKRIPIAAGLGGGSADAAAVLRLAIAASGILPDRGELTSLAMSLGADVPSQLEPATALVTGAGEGVEPLDTPMRLAGVILAGKSRLSTARVYERADELGATGRDLAAVTAELRGAIAAANGEALALARVMRNDLQAAALDLEPEAERALHVLHEAEAFAYLLSGSGPAAFGLFQDREDAELEQAGLAARWPGGVFAVEAAPPGFGRASA
jgi:4-diphosphocytidyl-2-C-methyl-D-erythritol kinase